MIIVDHETCVGCGLCARICHERCISVPDAGTGASAQIDQALCSTCTQCIAICPRQALSWDGVPPAVYDAGRLPTAAQLEELFRQRRTVRHFRHDRIDRELIQEIVTCGIYAPTNNTTLRTIVVDDRTILKALDVVMMTWVARIYTLIYKSRVVFGLVKAITPAVDAKGRAKLAHSLQVGRGWGALPAAMIMVVGDRRILLSEASAQYALSHMILYAQAQGIGSRINAAGSIVFDRNRAARKQLGLLKHEHILGALELGYPAVRFRNKVEGKTMPLGWNGRPSDG